MNDLISRQATIDALDALCDSVCEYSKKQRSVMCGACHLGSAFDVAEQMPSAQPDQKKGKWLEHKDYPSLAYLCSECNHFTTIRFPFCPNCGARMEEEE